jgi:hypothetical protein
LQSVFQFRESTFSRIIYPVTLVAGVLACYWFTLDYPFVFDDFGNIAGNPVIRDLKEPGKIIGFNPTRWIIYFSFALNNYFGGISPAGYRIVNLLIHAVNGLLIYALAVKLLSTPALKSRTLPVSRATFAFFPALLFVVHPLMTESVTYVVQRLVSLSTLFFLLCFLLWIEIRIRQIAGKKQQIPFVAGFILSGLCAFFSRENTWVLPLFLLVAEKLFFANSKSNKKWMKGFWILNITGMATIGFYAVFSGKYFSPIPPMETHPYALTATSYYLTQVEAFCTYLRLLIFPAGQVFDRDCHIVTTPFDLGFAICFIVLTAYIVLTATTVKKHPYLAFSLFWFLAALLPQSAVPRPNVFFEHRVYLPSIGVFLAFSYFLFSGGWQKKYIPLFLLICLSTVFAFLTIQRNRIWQDEITLWKDTLEKCPGNARAWSNLGHAEYSGKNYREAESDFRKASALRPENAWLHYNLSLSQIAQGKGDLAILSISKAIDLDNSHAIFFHDRGVMFAMQGNYPLAMIDFSSAIRIDSNLASAYSNRARIYGIIGDTVLKDRDLEKALILKKQHAP